MKHYKYGSAYVGKHARVDLLVAQSTNRSEIIQRIAKTCVQDLLYNLFERNRVMITEGYCDVSVEMVVVTAEEIDMLYKALMSSREAAAHAMREIFGDWAAIPGEIRFPESMPDYFGEDY